MVSTGASAGLGLVFWIVAAHLTQPSEVGRASAEVSGMTLLAMLSQLNLVNVFTRFLPRSGAHARRFVVVGYTVCFSIGIVVSTGFVLFGWSHRIITPGSWHVPLFVVSVGLSTVFVLQDSVLTGLRSARWVPVENSAFGAGKLLLLLPFAGLGAAGIFLAWVLPVVPAVLGVNLYLFARRIPMSIRESGGRSEFPKWRTLRNFVIAEYTSSLVGGLASYLLPLIVLSFLGAKAAAYFYLPWLIGNVMQLLLWNVSTSYVVEAGYQRNQLKALLRHAGRLALSVLLPIIVVLVAGAPIVLRLLGPGYSTHGSTLLRLVAISVVPMSVTVLFQTFMWYEGRLWQLVGVQSATVAMFFALTLPLLTHFGIETAGIALLVSQSVTAVVVLPATIGRWRALPGSPGGPDS